MRIGADDLFATTVALVCAGLLAARGKSNASAVICGMTAGAWIFRWRRA